ncbi:MULTISPECIES: hypothetical protein [unclassified Streptomyces]|uniref:hypothetical protein n=1 Tax=unclassified Streptomyces TaxID=2593676 RepID=UPI00225458B8|nr:MULTISPECIES: hypothetical protein [unclassified Streptomyces]MCX4404632.1 hypothetical protein [Streptomyces sp. NBC_01764]MCX5190824.1 hypothetical protein [Streptomyces sp. NBC_00268]
MRFDVIAVVSFLVPDYRRLLVVEPGLSWSVAAGLLVELAEPFDFCGVGVDGPGPALVGELVGRDPAALDPSEKRHPGHAKLAGEVGRPPLVVAELCGFPVESLFLQADAAQVLQQRADALGAEVFAAFRRTEAL